MNPTILLLLTFAVVWVVCVLRPTRDVTQKTLERWYAADKELFIFLGLLYLVFAIVGVAKDHWRFLDALWVWLTGS